MGPRAPGPWVGEGPYYLGKTSYHLGKASYHLGKASYHLVKTSYYLEKFLTGILGKKALLPKQGPD